MRPSASTDRPRRSYRTAEAVAHDAGVAVALDGRVAKTPAGRPLVLPTQASAVLVAGEWAGQGETLDHATMPSTRLAFTVIDRLDGAGARLAAEVARYAANDTLCHFAEAPDALVERQVTRWGPVLDWARETLGVDLARGSGLLLTPQRPEAVARVARLVEDMEPFVQAGVAYAAPLFGSAVLALALRLGVLDGDAAFDLSRLEAAFQEERWGLDAEAEQRTALLREEARWLDLWFRALDVLPREAGEVARRGYAP